jgi:hypothetical protein
MRLYITDTFFLVGLNREVKVVLDALTMAYWRRKQTNTVKLHSNKDSQWYGLRHMDTFYEPSAA